MNTRSRIVRNAVIALAVAPFAIVANAADLKFRAASGHELVIGRYRVTLDASVAADIATASAEALARAYGGQLELFATSDVRQFAIAMLPARARTLSADARVREVVEIAQPEADASAAPASPSAVLSTSGIARHLVPVVQDTSSSGTYLYDGAGNIKNIGTDSYVYDIEGRLTQATVQGNQQSYTYDVFGNRLSATRATNAAGCVHGCEATVTVDHHSNHLGEQTYDAAGNVITGFGSVYTYDGTGMVTSATVSSITDQRDFAYTADDERIAVRQGVSWTWSVRDQSGKVLREFTSTETSSPFGLTNHYWSKDYVWRDGLLLASVFPNTPGTTTPTTTYHYHLDHLGTPRLVTDGNHILVGKHTYYPFGAEMDLTPHESAVELMKFTGHERDIVAADNATVDYMHARYYNGNLGRFLEVDRGASADTNAPQTWNKFSYARNNPLSRVDRDGLREKLFIFSTYGYGFGESTFSRNQVRQLERNTGKTAEVVYHATRDEILEGSRRIDRTGTDVLVITGHANPTIIQTWGLFGNDKINAGDIARALQNGKPQAVVLFGCDTSSMAEDLSKRLGGQMVAGVDGKFDQLRGMGEFAEAISDLLKGGPSEVDGKEFKVFGETAKDMLQAALEKDR